MNENMHSYKSNPIIKSIYEISQKLENIYPIPKKYKINKSLKEKKNYYFCLYYNINYIINDYFKNMFKK